MNCPFCSNKLVEIKTKSALVDICYKCKGIWFDSGELVDFVKNLTESQEISPITPQLFKEPKIETIYTTKEKDKACPRCNKKLQRFNYLYDSNVFIDKCPECKGMWADGGEAKEIARHLKDDPRIRTIAKSFLNKPSALEDFSDLSKVLMRPVSPVVLFMPKIIIPLSDDTPRERIPIVTIGIIILCTLIFIGQMAFIQDAKGFFLRCGLVPRNFLSWSLISSMFLHGGLLHLFGNMFFLWLFGDNVEDRFSRFGFFVFYLSCGLAASILHSIINWQGSLPAVGASGAISGIMGAYLVFYPAAKLKMLIVYKIVNVPAFLYLGFWFLFQLVFGIFYTSLGISSIGWFAHIGGFVFGVLIAYIRIKKRKNN